MTTITTEPTYTVKFYKSNVMTTWRKFDNIEEAQFYANLHREGHSKVTIDTGLTSQFIESAKQDEETYWNH